MKCQCFCGTRTVGLHVSFCREEACIGLISVRTTRDEQTLEWQILRGINWRQSTAWAERLIMKSAKTKKKHCSGAGMILNTEMEIARRHAVEDEAYPSTRDARDCDIIESWERSERRERDAWLSLCATCFFDVQIARSCTYWLLTDSAYETTVGSESCLTVEVGDRYLAEVPRRHIVAG